MKKFMAFFLVVVFVFAACSVNQNQLSENDPYNFTSYEDGENISDIEQVALSDNFAKICYTYKFSYYPDNCQVIGYISIPVACIKSKTPCEVVVYNRGGNSDLGLLGDEDTSYICQKSGRIVIASQYRGSKGCTGNDEFGGADLNDVLKLIDLCEEFAFVSMSDLCVAGVSRGGMMSYMTARKDNRVKKIVAVSALTDLVSSYNDRGDVKELMEKCIGGSPEQLPDEYEERSAINWADEIKVPTLVIHSKQDSKVPFKQAEDMTKALKNSGDDCSFITYNDDTHGLHSRDGEIISKWLNNEDISEYLDNIN